MKLRSLLCTFLLCLFLGAGKGFAQYTIHVEGYIKDSLTHEAMPAVSVMLKGTTIGTVTDNRGHFSLQATSPGNVLHVSFMILEATERAEAQIRQAEDKANALQLDAERKHTEIMATVKKQQSALEGRIAELRTFEREYRTRLKTYLESQLEELSTRDTAAPHDADDN